MIQMLLFDTIEGTSVYTSPVARLKDPRGVPKMCLTVSFEDEKHDDRAQASGFAFLC